MIQLELTLLSDALPGAGEFVGGYVDRDIIYDLFGLPYIPSKRMKGILKNSARDLEDCGLLRNNLNEIFGNPGITDNYFTLSNEYLRN